MNRWLFIGSLMGVLALGTGCQSMGSRDGCSTYGPSQGMPYAECGSGNCGCGNGGYAACSSGSCGQGHGGACNCGPSGGLMGKVRGRLAGCKTGCGRTGCQAGPLGWQQGGLDYSSHLNPGRLGHNAGAAVANQPFRPGAPSAQVAYPYYTHRGPRDFLMANPPSIGP